MCELCMLVRSVFSGIQFATGKRKLSDTNSWKMYDVCFSEGSSPCVYMGYNVPTEKDAGQFPALSFSNFPSFDVRSVRGFLCNFNHAFLNKFIVFSLVNKL